MSTLTLDRDEIVRLAALATGDEKHEASSYSTLDALLVLYGRVLQVDPTDPAWEQRDRFILSKGHGPAAYYAVLSWRGFFPEHWLPTFTRQGSRLGSHPDRLLVPGVEASTGSLGHGLPLARRGRPRTAGQGRRPARRCPDGRRRAERGLELGGDHAGPPAAAGKPHAAGDRQPLQHHRSGSHPRAPGRLRLARRAGRRPRPRRPRAALNARHDAPAAVVAAVGPRS